MYPRCPKMSMAEMLITNYVLAEMPKIWKVVAGYTVEHYHY